MKSQKKYISPDIEQIILDKEISLILQSDPMEGPGESRNLNVPENEPFFMT